MKIALLASLLATAAAFAPAQQRVASTTALAMYAPGVGDEIWDPLGLYTLGSGKAFDTFPNMFPKEQFLIEAETKHCRMAMLGWTGIWATTEVSSSVE
jgi:Chlorophyll A-B binding protein